MGELGATAHSLLDPAQAHLPSKSVTPLNLHEQTGAPKAQVGLLR